MPAPQQFTSQFASAFAAAVTSAHGNTALDAAVKAVEEALAPMGIVVATAGSTIKVRMDINLADVDDTFLGAGFFRNQVVNKLRFVPSVDTTDAYVYVGNDGTAYYAVAAIGVKALATA